MWLKEQISKLAQPTLLMWSALVFLMASREVYLHFAYSSQDELRASIQASLKGMTSFCASTQEDEDGNYPPNRYAKQPFHAIYGHIMPSLFWSIAFPIQYWKAFRRRFINIHRWMGRFAILTSFWMAINVIFMCLRDVTYSKEDEWFSINMASYVSIPIFIFWGLHGWAAARRKDIITHRRSMIRHGLVGYGVAMIRVYGMIMGIIYDINHKAMLERVGAPQAKDSSLTVDDLLSDEWDRFYYFGPTVKQCKTIFGWQAWLGFTTTVIAAEIINYFYFPKHQIKQEITKKQE